MVNLSWAYLIAVALSTAMAHSTESSVRIFHISASTFWSAAEVEVIGAPLNTCTVTAVMTYAMAPRSSEPLTLLVIAWS